MIAGTCSVGFTVPDIDKSFRDLQSKGVRFLMPPKAREGEGIKLAIHQSRALRYRQNRHSRSHIPF